MAVKKFRTFEDAGKDLWEFHPDERYYQRIRALWRFAYMIRPLRCEHGIFRYKTHEEAAHERLRMIINDLPGEVAFKKDGNDAKK